MLIVRQTDGIGTYLTNQSHIFGMFLFADRPAQILTVLMTGNTVQRIAAAVQEKALIRIHRKTAETN